MTIPLQRVDWRQEYELAKPKFLIYDKQSGSRWLDDENLLQFITTVETDARRSERKVVAKELLMALPFDYDNAEAVITIGRIRALLRNLQEDV